MDGEGAGMNENMIVLDLLEDTHITVEEALRLLNAMADKKPSIGIPQQVMRNRDHRIKVNLIMERESDA